jgi:hypothetical protein
MYSEYEVILPEIPPDWERVLGQALWQIEWIDADGSWRKIEAVQSDTLNLEICNTQINPVIAYPYWPEKNIHPGTFYPAGAIFPLDTSEGTIDLDWQAGIDAQLYKYLARFNNDETRRPEQFDWQRFRRLLRTEIDDEDIKADPWIVDWEAAAKRIAESGFRSSYIKSKEYTNINITVPESALWISPSPFEAGKAWEAGETISLKAAESPSRYVSSKGTIVFTNKTWEFFVPISQKSIPRAKEYLL